MYSGMAMDTKSSFECSYLLLFDELLFELPFEAKCFHMFPLDMDDHDHLRALCLPEMLGQ